MVLVSCKYTGPYLKTCLCNAMKFKKVFTNLIVYCFLTWVLYNIVYEYNKQALIGNFNLSRNEEELIMQGKYLYTETNMCCNIY